MRLAMFEIHGSRRPGLVRGGVAGEMEIVDLGSYLPSGPDSVKAILEEGADGLSAAAAALASAPGIPLAQVRLLAPILDPQKVICVGLNYADHAAETGAKYGDEPVIFCKLPTTVIGTEAAIELPPESDQVDFEAELVVVIGRRARRVSRESAGDYIAGYSCGNDVSARDWQKNKPGRQWLLGKSFDTFAPLGPWITTPDEAGDPGALRIELRLNGAVMQRSNTNQLIFPIDFLVSYLSHVCTLHPGDLIFTGTPAGVGMARTPPVFLKPGDELEVAIDGLGTLRNQVVAAVQPEAW